PLPQLMATPAVVPNPPPVPRRREPSPGDHTWNVPLPPTGGVSVFGAWPMGIESISPSSRPVVPPPAPLPPPSNLRVTTIPSPDETNQARDATPPMERLRPESVPTPNPEP